MGDLPDKVGTGSFFPSLLSTLGGMVCFKRLGVASFYRIDGETERDGQATVATWLRATRGMAGNGDRSVVS